MTDAVDRTRAGGFLPVLPPRFALVELAVFALVIAAEYALEAFPDVSRLNPHPYWIGVLLLSLQYGTVSGLLAAALAIGGTLLLGLPEAEIGESYFAYLIRVWTQPVLWIVVALLLGSFRMRQIEERHDLQQQADDATIQAAVLNGHARQLKERVDGLERRLAALARPPTMLLLDGLGTLATSDQLPARHEAARAVIEQTVPGATWSLFIADQRGLTRLIGERWGERPQWRSSFSPSEPLMQALVDQARHLTILHAQDEAVLGAEGIAATPVIADNGRVVGMLKIEQLDAPLVDSGLSRRLAVIAPHLARLCYPEGAVASADRPTVVPLVRSFRNTGPTRPRERGVAVGMATARPPVEPRE